MIGCIENTPILLRLLLHSTSSTKISRNPFVETALTYALTYISTVLPKPHIKSTSITILADNDYYSQPANTPKNASHQFIDFGVRLQDAHKTGLGSSAALVTAFTGALLSHYLPESLYTSLLRTRPFNPPQPLPSLSLRCSRKSRLRLRRRNSCIRDMRLPTLLPFDPLQSWRARLLRLRNPRQKHRRGYRRNA